MFQSNRAEVLVIPPHNSWQICRTAILLAVCVSAAIADDQSDVVSGKSQAQSEVKVSEEQPSLQSRPLSTTALAETIRKSLVLVHATSRDGEVYGHGTGFVISEDGLIATARHVVGDRRAIRVDMPDGQSLPVTHIHAATEAVDLIVLKVDASDLTPLQLGDDSESRPGEPVVAVGHPGSLRNSVFEGIVSGRQDIAEIPMLQLAMTIEPGSSGEPVVDSSGDVIGLVTLKSTEVSNVGFAVPVNLLKSLLKNPTPVPMKRWMTIGALDPARWQTVYGANWRQRASRIMVEGTGSGFGGRTLCLQTAVQPDIPCEIQVDVKLDDESGAAGLVFHADGKGRHYGFYPSNGRIRFTRFDGPTVYQWTILHNEPNAVYQAGEWNTFKVRIEEDRILCDLNGRRVFETTDHVIDPGRAGVAAFRGTSASFRRFRIGAKLGSKYPSIQESQTIRSIVASVTGDYPAASEVVRELLPYQRLSSGFLEQEATRLEARAERLRQLAVEVHATKLRQQILTALHPPPEADTADSEPRSVVERPAGSRDGQSGNRTAHIHTTS